MNPPQLLAHFDRISEAPDAVPRLRRFILDLAVRGKLVEQDPKDEPASILLARLLEGRQVSAKARSQPTSLVAPGAEELPFELPPTWLWVRLRDITSYIQRGKSPHYAASDGLPVVSQKCVQWSGLDLSPARLITLESIGAYEEVRHLRDGDLLWNSTGTGTIGRVVRVTAPPPRLVCDSHVTVVRCLGVDPEFVRCWLRSDHVYGVIEDRAAGSTNQVELTSQMANVQLVPLPPLAEQHRIVGKVDELMALCDRLEAAQRERETRRDRVVAVSLNSLNEPAADDGQPFRDHAGFHLRHLPRLTTRPEHIQQLRQTILNLAVRGRLVPQDAEGEPSEAGGSFAAGVLVAMDGAPVLPRSWAWRAVAQLLREEMANGLSIPGRNEPPGIRALRLNAITARGIDVSVVRYLPITEARASRLTLAAGDFLLARGNGSADLVARGALVTEAPPELTIFPDTMIRLRLKADVSAAWFSHSWNSDVVRRQIRHVAKTAVGLWKVSQDQIAGIVLPVPPLAEQHRIVAKVDELMALCDQLEAQLTTAQTESRRLLEAVLHQALSPVA